jgi:CRISPR-associated protein Csx10
MKTITFTLEARQPLLLTSLQGDPNSSVSFDYIPGSVIRGALIGRYRAAQLAGGPIDPSDPTSGRLFFDGSTRFLNGYGLAPDGSRSLPLPRSLARDKESDDDKLYDLSIDPAEGRPMIPSKLTYGVFDRRGSVQPVSVARRVKIHNQRDRAYGRGVEGSGALFRYEAIAAGQRFGAAVLCDADQDAAVVEALLRDAVLRLGGSRNAGYGEAAVVELQRNDGWHELGGPPGGRALGMTLRVTLLSDMFARDSEGGAALEPPRDDLVQLLGVREARILMDHSFRAAVVHGGFNRTWGLPLPQRSAIAAGSVFTLSCDTAPTPEAVARLEWHGLGERRAEGFGRVVIAGPPLTATCRVANATRAPVPVAPALSESSATLAGEMARRLLAQRMEAELIDRSDIFRIQGEAIANTQLSRLRIVARRALGDEPAQRMRRVGDLLTTLPANARDQFERAHIGTGGDRLLDWLRHRVADPFADWDRERVAVELAGARAELDEDLATRYTLRLIMSVARLKVKEAD